jgi:predicted TIM-barrel fold metal-dependent hydrolase
MPKIFDVHAHYRGGVRGGFGGPQQQQPEESPQERMDYHAQKLREAGVVKACILARGAVGDGPGISFEDAIKTMQPHMDIVVPVAHLDPDPASMTPERLGELHAMGYRGIKINNTAREYDDPAYFPVYEQAEELGMPILFHMGVTGGGLDYARTHPRRDPIAAEMYQRTMERLANPPEQGPPGFGGRRNMSANRMRPFHLDTLSTNFPRLKLIGAHLGGTGSYDEAASVARWRHFVWFDLSGGEIIERHAYERGYIGREIGVEKLVWGSDCPPDEIATHVKRLEVIFDLLNLKPDERDRIWYRNAAEIYGFEEPDLAAP